MQRNAGDAVGARSLCVPDRGDEEVVERAFPYAQAEAELAERGSDGDFDERSSG